MSDYTEGTKIKTISKFPLVSSMQNRDGKIIEDLGNDTCVVELFGEGQCILAKNEFVIMKE